MLDGGVDQVDGELMRPLALAHQGGGGFAGPLSGIADAAHRHVPVAEKIDFDDYDSNISLYYIICIIIYVSNLR